MNVQDFWFISRCREITRRITTSYYLKHTCHPIIAKSSVLCYFLLEMHRLTGQWSDFSHDRPRSVIGPVSLTSCRFRADPFIASGAGDDVTATRTLTVVCKHVVSLENDSNFNCIQCKWRLIMYLYRARWGLHSLNVCVRETAHTK